MPDRASIKKRIKDKLGLGNKLKDLVPESIFESYRVDADGRYILHGYLRIRIVRAVNLRNRDCGSCCHNLSDPYVTVHAGAARLVKTGVVMDELDPVWDEEFVAPVAHPVHELELRVKDWNAIGIDRLGTIKLPVTELLSFDESDREQRAGVHRIEYLDGMQRHGSLEYFIEYTPSWMVLEKYDSWEAPGTYFSSREGNDVKFYVNADCKLDEGAHGHQPQRCWNDIYDSLVEAKKFIYIAGWAIDHTQNLLRGDDLQNVLSESKPSPQIGELLKMKAEEGVCVCLLVWDDQTSTSYRKSGVMGTKDEHLREFFVGSRVHLHLVGIDAAESLRGKVGETLRNKVFFTHHQKTVICDDGRGDSVGYLGGIDLYSGRYDSDYPLFRSLQSHHRDDFYNGCLPQARAEFGPRQPWHDIHLQVRGPAVRDLIRNFHERWQRQASTQAELVEIPEDVSKVKNGPWKTQLLRSIDMGTAMLTATDDTEAGLRIQKYTQNGSVRGSQKASRMHLVHSEPKLARTFHSSVIGELSLKPKLGREGGVLFDRSIQDSLVHFIRRAKHCIYIESQYFLSSSFIWPKHGDSRCENLIAAELTWKICQKIESKERFAAYILLPMWPEGVPDSVSVQEVLRWQHNTMQSMYERIASAIKKMHNVDPSFEAEPTDYLNFYCLANRELDEGTQSIDSPRCDSEKLMAKTRRHLIYVHSKMAIVDDSLALVGSANINERSLAGTRDTEVSQASWQPESLPSDTGVAEGDVHRFRLYCWAHLSGGMRDVFRRPASLECIQQVNDIAEENWKRFNQSEICEMDSYLCKYPISVDKASGVVKPITNDGCFPDTKAKITGKKTFLPQILTT